MTLTDKVKQTAKDETDRVSGLAQDTVKSGAYLYPIKVIESPYHEATLIDH